MLKRRSVDNAYTKFSQLNTIKSKKRGKNYGNHNYQQQQRVQQGRKLQAHHVPGNQGSQGR